MHVHVAQRGGVLTAVRCSILEESFEGTESLSVQHLLMHVQDRLNHLLSWWGKGHIKN
jgi:hypothetical protein